MHMCGETRRRPPRTRREATVRIIRLPDVAEDLTPSKFANGDAISYRTSAGETLFALQLKPRLDALPTKPLDLLVMVDTSASQAQGPLASAIAITEQLG